MVASGSRPVLVLRGVPDSVRQVLWSAGDSDRVDHTQPMIPDKVVNIKPLQILEHVTDMIEFPAATNDTGSEVQ